MKESVTRDPDTLKRESQSPIWKLYKADERRTARLTSELGISQICAQILVNRGIVTVEAAHEFLYGSLSSLSDPFIMKDMSAACDRIKKAVSLRQKILIYGDYDVDGVASCALLSRVFSDLKADFEVFIPDRLDEGYGLNTEAVERAAAGGVKLIVTVDCGINAQEEVRRANALGIDVVITDHHEIKERALPPAIAVVDPNRFDCPYPYKHLAGVGVAYFLTVALLGEHDRLYEHLDLVALGSVADVVPLNGENRILVKNGLKVLKETKKPGLKALFEVAGLKRDRPVTARDIAFSLAPRINAMGRMGNAFKAYELLYSDDPVSGRKTAMDLEKNNRERKSIETAVFKEALKAAETQPGSTSSKALVLAGEAWHPGVIGIVAARIAEKYSRPAVIVSLEGEEGRASARSVEGVDIFSAIKNSGVDLIRFGGHEQACGLSIRTEDIPRFTEGLEKNIKERTPETSPLQEVKIDYHLPFSHITEKMIDEISLLMPHGQGNPSPLFVTGGLKVLRPARNVGRGGVKFHVGFGNMACEAISFARDRIPRPKKGQIIDLVYAPSINSFRGIDSIQLNIKDLRISPGA